MKPSALRAIGAIILGLWAVSLLLPVFTTCRPGYDHVQGWFLLALGWFGFMAFMPAWLANMFILLMGTMLVLEFRPRLWIGIACAVFAATAWWFTDWYDDTGAVPICHYHAGYWLWLAVALIVLAVPLIVRLRSNNA
jgi:hypothetical protein